MNEAGLQTQAAAYLDLCRGLLWCHVPNGGARNAAVGGQLKAQGVKRGVPDVMVYTPTATGHAGLAVELKVGRNTPTVEQKAWLASLRRCGWVTEVARSLDEVRALVRTHYPRHAR